ncbi:MAG: GNAT family N-acetyltransferase [Xanthomonadaceae bacterium]|nr:GNAT family N-acetyltransferase [Xanthomonadaceae bacterium]
MSALYPAESNHFDGVDSLRQSNVRFVAAWLGDRMVGCGAVKRLPGPPAYGEIKRLFVAEDCRGCGVSRQIMAVLEQTLSDAGIGLARLETGIHQPEAIGLYRALGYRDRPPFGDYLPDPLSLFMEKRLG